MKGIANMRVLIDLFLTFFRVSILTFGGGYAMLPMLQREVVENKGWATEAEIIDYFALGQCTPGANAINVAVYVGSKVHGVLGGIFAPLGSAFPSIIIMTVIAAFVSNFSDLPAVQYAFAGIRVGVCALILKTILTLVKNSLIDLPTILMCILVFVGSVFLDLSPVLYVVLAAIAGIIIVGLKEGKKV